MDNFKFYLEDNDGNREEYSVVYTLHSDITEKDYLIYTDGTTDSEGNLELLAGTYDRENPNMPIGSIDSDEEWAVVEELLDNKLNEPIEDDE